MSCNSGSETASTANDEIVTLKRTSRAVFTVFELELLLSLVKDREQVLQCKKWDSGRRAQEKCWGKRRGPLLGASKV